MALAARRRKCNAYRAACVMSAPLSFPSAVASPAISVSGPTDAENSAGGPAAAEVSAGGSSVVNLVLIIVLETIWKIVVRRPRAYNQFLYYYNTTLHLLYCDL